MTSGEPGEFELIARYFHDTVARRDVALGVGDDGAVVQPPGHGQLVQVVDTLVEDRHFPANLPPDAVGHRVLAVNLSDLAAMGAEPAWALLALTLPKRDEAWLAGFARGLGALAAEHGMALIGGDTTRGPLTITIQATGFAGQSLRRDGAQPGDRVWVSGSLGAAAGGLQAWQSDWQGTDSDALRQRFLWPTARVGLGQGLAGLAGAAIDISDGLLADAGHIAGASGVGLYLDTGSLPVAAAATRVLGSGDALAAVLRGGDDYELLFTASPQRDTAVRQAAADAGVAATIIGEVAEGSGVYLDGEPASGGYDHFAPEAP